MTQALYAHINNKRKMKKKMIDGSSSLRFVPTKKMSHLVFPCINSGEQFPLIYSTPLSWTVGPTFIHYFS
jgi:hypothetical protein